MNEETLKIAKKIEKLKREFSMLPPLSERYSILEIEEYQHYLLELEELLIVFKYLTQRKPVSVSPIVENNAPLEETKPEKEIIEEDVDFQQGVDNVEAEVQEILENESDEISQKDEILSEEKTDSIEVEEIETSSEENNLQPEAETTDEQKEDLNEKIENSNDQEAEKEIEPEPSSTPTFDSENLKEDSPSEMIATGSSLNDQIKHEDNSIATKLAKQPISDLRNAFGLNERFLYANELFGGDGQEFIRALNELNHLDSFDDAKRMLEARYENNFGWKKDDENVIAFVEVVERRYL